MTPQSDATAPGDSGSDAGGTAAAGPGNLFPEPPVRPEPVVEPKAPAKPKAPVLPEPEPEMRREPPAELQPEPTPPPAQPKPIPEKPAAPAGEAKPLPSEPKPLPAEPKAPATEPKPMPAEPATPVPPAKPRPEDENLFEAVSGVGWRAHRRFAVGASVAEDPAHPVTGPIAPVSHLDEPDPKRVPRVPFDPAAETRRVRAAR